jgi:CRP/FNR family cyclic AMP-dependent transcriptional regulator
MPSRSRIADIEALTAALPPALAALARLGQVQAYRKGAILIEEGDRGDTIYIILAGRLRAFSTNLEQDREITYGSYGPGEYVGELGLDGGPRTASVVADEPSICARVTRPTLEDFIAENPAFAFELLTKVMRLARMATLTARQLALNDVYGRIKLLLESLAPPGAGSGWVEVPGLRQSEIAARVGCTPSMVSRVMKDLATGGHVVAQGPSLKLKLPLPARW